VKPHNYMHSICTRRQPGNRWPSREEGYGSDWRTSTNTSCKSPNSHTI